MDKNKRRFDIKKVSNKRNTIVDKKHGIISRPYFKLFASKILDGLRKNGPGVVFEIGNSYSNWKVFYDENDKEIRNYCEGTCQLTIINYCMKYCMTLVVIARMIE